MSDPQDKPLDQTSGSSTPDVFDDLSNPSATSSSNVAPPLENDNKTGLEKSTPYRSNTLAIDDTGTVRNSLFWYRGRMGRLSMQAAFFAIMGIMMLMMIVLIILMVIIGFMIGMSGSGQSLGALTTVAIALVAIPVIVMCGYMLVFYVRRLHDLDRSGWWALAPLILSTASLLVRYFPPPGAVAIYCILFIINTIFTLYICLTPGTPSVNRFGPPRFTPTYEKVFGWIFALIMVLEYAFISWVMLALVNPPKAPHPHSTDTVISAPSNAGDTAETYPFSAQQLWDMMLTITALPTGRLTHEQIETALNMQMTPGKETIGGKTYLTHAGEEWYFATSLTYVPIFGKQQQIFSFNWNEETNKAAPQGMCINVDEIKPSLAAQGWTSNPLNMSLLPNSQTQYTKDHSNLTIYYDKDNHCLSQLMISNNIDK